MTTLWKITASASWRSPAGLDLDRSAPDSIVHSRAREAAVDGCHSPTTGDLGRHSHVRSRIQAAGCTLGHTGTKHSSVHRATILQAFGSGGAILDPKRYLPPLLT
jgi:hypothetical protein